MQRICYPLQNECKGLKPEIIRLITVVLKYSNSYLIFNLKSYNIYFSCRRKVTKASATENLNVK